MGYSENCCQICAVSINVARIRTKTEPPEAGWGYSGGLYYMGDEEGSRCALLKEKTGCEVVKNDEAGNDYLHFPGRGCCYQGAYSGVRIGADEMKGMNLPRYLVLKPKDADTESEEQEDYEWNSDFFVTSQTTCPPDDFEPGELAHVRFGVDNFFPQNYSVVDWEEQQWGVPVHDSCWEIFKRVSKIRLGEVDLQGFMALWTRQACGNCGFQNMKQDPVIAECREQFWTHLPGTEYLAANPHDIPGFPELLLEDYYTEHPKGDGVFDTRDAPHLPNLVVHENTTDVFTKIPAELKNMLLSHLSSKDIGSLRLASRSFRQLPKTLFRRLVHDELPWFWEHEYLEEKDLECLQKEREISLAGAKEEQASKNVNWLEIYKHLLIAKRSILGVRNRARVWGLAEEVVRRIAELRKQRNGLGFGFGESKKIKVQPMKEEIENGQVKNDLYCPRCEVVQIQAHLNEKDELDTEKPEGSPLLEIDKDEAEFTENDELREEEGTEAAIEFNLTATVLRDGKRLA